METPSITARTDVTLATSEPRVTPTPPRGAAFRDVLARTAVRGAESAMRSLPGAPLMAVALRGAGGTPTSIGVPLPGAGNLRSPEGPIGTSTGATASSAGLSALGASGTPGAGGEPGIEASLADSHDSNVYFLKLQESVNAENRYFTAVSNVLKAEHDTVKTAIGNIR